jgi:serine/threonine-protein kinase
MDVLFPGTSLGNYDIVRAIGRGGMGVVYEARHRSLGRRVAIKVLQSGRLGTARDEHVTARFLREGRAAAHVQHAHVVDVFDFGVANGAPFLVMELVEGEALADLLRRQGALPLAYAVELLLPILSALAELHASGIVHRDLKPENILIAKGRGGEGFPKLADFGVSRLNDGSPGVTESGTMVGTLPYMAPEQIRSSKDSTEQTDQYALAVILYECTTGRVPFEGASPYDRMHAILHAPLVAPSSYGRGLPAAFDAVIVRAMDRDPRCRFGCVDELARALLPFATEFVRARWCREFPAAMSVESTSAPPAEIGSPPVSRGARARPSGARLVVASCVCLATLAGTAWATFSRSWGTLAEPPEFAPALQPPPSSDRAAVSSDPPTAVAVARASPGEPAAACPVSGSSAVASAWFGDASAAFAPVVSRQVVAPPSAVSSGVTAFPPHPTPHPLQAARATQGSEAGTRGDGPLLDNGAPILDAE